MTRFTPCWVKRVSPLFPCLGLTIDCSDFYFVWQMVPYIFNVLIDMFEKNVVNISRKNNQKTQNMTRFTPHHPIQTTEVKIEWGKNFRLNGMKNGIANEMRNV